MILLKGQYGKICQFFNSLHLSFLFVPYLTFQKVKHWNLDITGY